MRGHAWVLALISIGCAGDPERKQGKDDSRGDDEDTTGDDDDTTGDDDDTTDDRCDTVSFADDATAWSLPQLPNDYVNFYQLAGDSYCGTDGNYNFYYQWSTIDIDGDDDPDLVLTSYACDGIDSIDSSRWDVYFGECAP